MHQNPILGKSVLLCVAPYNNIVSISNVARLSMYRFHENSVPLKYFLLTLK